MGFKRADSFYYNAAADFLARRDFLQWQFPNVSTPVTFQFVNDPNGIGKWLEFGGNLLAGPVVRGVWADRNQEAFWGIRMILPPGIGLQVTLMDTVANAAQVAFYFNASNYSVTAYRGAVGGTVLGISSNNVWIGDTQQFIEFHYKIANSGGSLEVRNRNGAILTLTGLDSQNTANAWADAFDVLPIGPTNITTATVRIKDFYYNDTTSDSGASPNNSYLGDVGVRALFPTADSSVQWTKNGGSSNFGRVNEVAMDSDTTYNSTSIPGDEDQFSAQSLTNVVALVVALQVRYAARKDDVGPRVIKGGISSGGTVSYGASNSLPDTYAYFTDHWVLDPHTTLNWTRSGINAALPLYNMVS